MSHYEDKLESFRQSVDEDGDPLQINSWPKPDKKYMYSQCKFMRESLKDLSKLDFLELVNFVSIFSKLGPDKKQNREFVDLYKKHVEDPKAENIAEAWHFGSEISNPFTCKAIKNLKTGSCDGCQFSKCPIGQSPINVRAKDYMPSKDYNFWIVREGKDDQITYTSQLDCDDLCKQYDLEHGFVTNEDNEITYLWNGRYLEPVKRSRAKQFVVRHVDDMDRTRKTKKAHHAEFLDRMACTNLVPDSHFTAEKLEAKINVLNGIVDIERNIVIPHNNTFPFRYCLDYEYDPNAKCPKFEQFLLDVTLNRLDLVYILQEYLGYILAGGPCRISKALFLDGEGRNGKSKFMDIIKGVIGSANYSSLSLSAINDPNNRLMMVEKLVNIGEETNKNALMRSEEFKTMVSGGEIVVKSLYDNTFVVRNKTKLVLACNGMPKNDDRTYGLLRRLLIIPFDARFEGSNDVQDIDKIILKDEKPGILNFAIEGYKRLKQQNFRFTESEIAHSKLAQYQLENDSIMSFAHDHLVFHKNYAPEHEAQSVIKTELYQKYRVYCMEKGFKGLFRDNQFWPKIMKLEPDLVEKREVVLGQKVRKVYGITYIDEK